MNSDASPSLESLVNRLMTSPFENEEGQDARGSRLEVLAECIEADAFALLRIRAEEESVVLLEETGMRTSPDKSPVKHRSVFLTQLASEGGNRHAVFSPELGPEDPFLTGEGAVGVILSCVDSVAGKVGTIAVRRGGKDFSPSEISRFGALAYVINLETKLRLVLEEKSGLPGCDPATGLGLFPDFYRTLGMELSRNRRKAGEVTAGILNLEPVEGRIPEEGDVAAVAGILGEQLRDFDTVFRYSSRELGFILPDIGGEEAFGVVERVFGKIMSVVEKEFYEVFIGYSSYPEDASTIERLIETAEAAVNLAREKGSFSISRWKD
jgi:GGDEF domain-containing protein